MDKFMIFSLNYCGESDYENVEELREILQKVGVKVELKAVEGTNFHHLTFNYDTNVVQKKTTRNAGGPRKYIEGFNRVPVAEIRERMKTETADEISKSLGISRSTLFRKLNHAEELGMDYIV